MENDAKPAKKCPHCYSEIDGRATACPNCGRRLYSNALLYGIIVVAAVLAILLICAVVLILSVGAAYGDIF